MIQALLVPMRERIEQGLSKDDLKKEVLLLGYSESDFETSYQVVLSQIQNGIDVPVIQEEVSTPPVPTPKKTSTVRRFLMPALLFVGVLVIGGILYVFLPLLSNSDKSLNETNLSFETPQNVKIEPQPLFDSSTPLQYETELPPETETGSETSTQLQIKEIQNDPNEKVFSDELNDILVCKKLFALWGISNEQLLVIKEETVGDKLSRLLDDIKKSREPSAKDICIADAALSGWAINQEVLSLYMNNVNKAYKTNLLSLEADARAEIIFKYEKELSQRNALQASVKALISSSNATVLHCFETSGVFSSPKEGELICLSSSDTWPVVSKYGARWGGCETQIDVKDSSFKYCAILQNNSVFICTQNGCTLN